MAIGRPVAFDPELALEAAMQQFWRAGYAATTMQDLLRVMGLSKSSLYQAFGSKKELFHRCLERYTRGFTGQLNDKLNAAENGRDFIEGVIRQVVSEASCRDKIGCLIVNTANEMGQSDQEVAKLIDAGIRRLTRVFEQAIISAQASGEIRSDKDPKTLASFLIMNICGLRTMVKGGSDEKLLFAAAEVALGALN